MHYLFCRLPPSQEACGLFVSDAEKTDCQFDFDDIKTSLNVDQIVCETQNDLIYGWAINTPDALRN